MVNGQVPFKLVRDGQPSSVRMILFTDTWAKGHDVAVMLGTLKLQDIIQGHSLANSTLKLSGTSYNSAF